MSIPSELRSHIGSDRVKAAEARIALAEKYTAKGESAQVSMPRTSWSLGDEAPGLTAPSSYQMRERA